MEMRDLLEKMMKFAGEKVGQKPGDQWRGSDKAPPGKKLVGDSILKDLSKGPKAKSKEQELAEEFQAFLEAEFKDTVDKRPSRKGARPSRGHAPQPRYKTVKTENWPKMVEFTPEIVNLLKSKGYRGPYDLNTVKKLYKELNGSVSGISGNDLIMIKGDSFVIPSGSEFLVGAEGQMAPATAKQLLKHLGESSMSEKDIELQDYRSMSHKEFQTAYGMTKTEWMNKNKALVIKNPSIKKGLGLDEGVPYKATNPHPALQDPVVKKVLKQMRPGLTGLEMNNEAFLYFAYELGKHRAREMWEQYGPAIKYGYQSGIGVNEGWESGPEEYKEPYDDADDAYDRHRQEKIDTEAEKEWAKLPKVSTYKLLGRGPNMEPNYEFDGKEYNTLEAAIEARKKLMADPNTPHPEHIGIQTLTRVVDKEQTDENSVTAPQNKAHADQMMKDLTKLQTDVPNPDPELAATIARRKDILTKQTKDLDMEESRGHKIIATKLKDIERAKRFASGELNIPTPQERQAQLKKLEKEKPVKEYGASNVTPYGQPAVDPKKAAQVAQGAQAFKAATGITAPATNIAKALDDASQGKPADRTSMKVLEPAMQDLVTIMSDPKLGSEYKSLAQKVNQKQQKSQ